MNEMDDVAALADERDEVQVVHSVVPVDATQYYGGVYWNNYADVIGYMNRRVTGDDDVDVWEWFHRQTGRTFRRARDQLRQWLGRALAARAWIHPIGRRHRRDSGAHRRRPRQRRRLPLRYEVADTNQADFPDDDFDLVVNHAAFHHVAYLDAVLRRCCELLPADGLLVNHDYVETCNQYGYDAWSQVHRVNQQLPERLRQKLVYPHLPTMLVTDPTEAVHSELTLAVTRRYFDLDEYRSVGGAIAYPLLTHNQAMAAAPLSFNIGGSAAASGRTRAGTEATCSPSITGACARRHWTTGVQRLIAGATRRRSESGRVLPPMARTTNGRCSRT